MRESHPFFEEQEVKPEWVLDPEEFDEYKNPFSGLA